MLSNQGSKIPSAFSKFVGYINPELHKHRKRQVGDMSGSVLDSMSKHLFYCLQASYWDRNEWVEMKIREILLVENFARCLSNYMDYLEGSK